jgi:uncharacterized protein YjlB
MPFQDIHRNPEILVHLIVDDGTFPNNEHLPLLVLKGVFPGKEKADPDLIERTFGRNKWQGSWRNGLYPFHHYHSTAHEVLGIYSGSVRVQFGGEEGKIVVASAGDVLVLPAGLAHKNIWSSHDFRVVGAYPAGTSWDMNYGKEGERPGSDKNIAMLAIPETDPVYGTDGPLKTHWTKLD